ARFSASILWSMTLMLIQSWPTRTKIAELSSCASSPRPLMSVKTCLSCTSMSYVFFAPSPTCTSTCAVGSVGFAVYVQDGLFALPSRPGWSGEPASVTASFCVTSWHGSGSAGDALGDGDAEGELLAALDPPDGADSPHPTATNSHNVATINRFILSLSS